jgi:hypothetical protein
VLRSSNLASSASTSHTPSLALIATGWLSNSWLLQRGCVVVLSCFPSIYFSGELAIDGRPDTDGGGVSQRRGSIGSIRLLDTHGGVSQLGRMQSFAERELE